MSLFEMWAFLLSVAVLRRHSESECQVGIVSVYVFLLRSSAIAADCRCRNVCIQSGIDGECEKGYGAVALRSRLFTMLSSLSIADYDASRQRRAGNWGV